VGRSSDEPKPETPAKRRQREAYEAAVERAVDAAPPVSEAVRRRLEDIVRRIEAGRGEGAAVTGRAGDTTRDSQSETERVEARLDQLAPVTVESRNAVHLRAIVAAKGLVTAADAALTAAVRAARAAGDSWAVIGAALGIGERAARERYGDE
jgi:hypothetical protein